MLDLLIRGGTIIDGRSKKPFCADVAIENGIIAGIGTFKDANARKVIDARGYYVTPGFIDIHRHADAAVFRPQFGDLELAQGLTTIVNGNCGLSLAPFSPAHRHEILSYLQPIIGSVSEDVPTDSLSAYFKSLPQLPINVGMLSGGGVLRADAAGYALETLETPHYQSIHRAMERSLQEGALGISLGLGYAPECFYTTEELIRMLSPLAHQNIPVTVHMRQEGTDVCQSIREMIHIAKELDLPMHISHLKAMGRNNWGTKIPEALSIIDSAHQDGLDITCDVYPYTAGSTQLLHILPPEFLSGGTEAITKRLQDPVARRELAARIESGDGFDNIAALAGWDGIFLTSLHLPENTIYQGKNLLEIAAMRGSDPLNTCCDLLVQEKCNITMIDFMASESDIESILRFPYSNLISDATYPTEGKLHPRVYGTFTHLLEHFVVQRQTLSLPSAIAKMTSLPADALRLERKGYLAPQMDADINIFKLESLHESATYTDPCVLSQGMDTVIVGGEVAWHHEKRTNTYSGKVIIHE